MDPVIARIFCVKKAATVIYETVDWAENGYRGEEDWKQAARILSANPSIIERVTSALGDGDGYLEFERRFGLEIYNSICGQRHHLPRPPYGETRYAPLHSPAPPHLDPAIARAFLVKKVADVIGQTVTWEGETDRRPADLAEAEKIADTEGVWWVGRIAKEFDYGANYMEFDYRFGLWMFNFAQPLRSTLPRPPYGRIHFS